MKSQFTPPRPLCLLMALTLCAPFSIAYAADTQPNSAEIGATKNRTEMNDIPPRLQWEANYGYCGETALISAGLYYGQYVSQFDARAIASPNVKQSKRGSQLLLGRNDGATAAQMRLKAVEWDSPTTANANRFLAWVKGNVVSGYPVIIGVYENFSQFENEEGAKAMANTTISFPSLAFLPQNQSPSLLPITLMTSLRSAITVFGRPMENRHIFTASSSEHFRRTAKRPMTSLDRCIHCLAAEKTMAWP